MGGSKSFNRNHSQRSDSPKITQTCSLMHQYARPPPCIFIETPIKNQPQIFDFFSSFQWLFYLSSSAAVIKLRRVLHETLAPAGSWHAAENFDSKLYCRQKDSFGWVWSLATLSCRVGHRNLHFRDEGPGTQCQRWCHSLCWHCLICCISCSRSKCYWCEARPRIVWRAVCRPCREAPCCQKVSFCAHSP